MIEIKLKLILVGDSGVGKSSLLKRKVDKKFFNDFVSTIGVDFNTLYFLRDTCSFKAYVWDTAGQEKFNTLIEVYYRDLTAGLVMYDINNRESYNNIDNWISKLRKENSEIPIFIIGTKTDVKNKREVYDTDLEKYKKEGISVFECSAKENTNIDELFNNIIDNIYTKIKNKELKPFDNNGIKIYNNRNHKIHTLTIDENNEYNEYKQNKCCTFL